MRTQSGWRRCNATSSRATNQWCSLRRPSELRIDDPLWIFRRRRCTSLTVVPVIRTDRIHTWFPAGTWHPTIRPRCAGLLIHHSQPRARSLSRNTNHTIVVLSRITSSKPMPNETRRLTFTGSAEDCIAKLATTPLTGTTHTSKSTQYLYRNRFFWGTTIPPPCTTVCRCAQANQRSILLHLKREEG